MTYYPIQLSCLSDYFLIEEFRVSENPAKEELAKRLERYYSSHGTLEKLEESLEEKKCEHADVESDILEIEDERGRLEQEVENLKDEKRQLQASIDRLQTAERRLRHRRLTLEESAMGGEAG